MLKERAFVGKSIDIIGEKYGKLTVLFLLQERKNKQKVWHCKCDCGNEIDVVQSALRSGNTKSCGCLLKENGLKQSQLRIKDLSGQQFGKWKVLNLDETKQKGHKHWICQCSCGTIRSVDGNTLRNGKSTSCGCQKFSKGEEKISFILTSNNIPFIAQWTTKECVFPDSGCIAKFDFFVNNEYIIEFDGKQHFECSHLGWDNEQNLKLTQKRDKYKNQWCYSKNLPIIRIPYTHLQKITLKDLKLETTKFLVKEIEL